MFSKKVCYFVGHFWRRILLWTPSISHFTSDGSGTASGFLMTYEGLQGVETTTEGIEPACILYFHYYMPSY